MRASSESTFLNSLWEIRFTGVIYDAIYLILFIIQTD